MATMTYRFGRSDPREPDGRARVAVFGADGATGQLAVRHALEAGHRVTACVADPAHLPLEHEGLRLVRADPRWPDSLWGVLDGHDAVLCLVGHKPAPLPSPDALAQAHPAAARATRALLEAMAVAGVERLLVLGAAGVGNSARTGRLGLGRWLRWCLPEVMADKERQERLVRHSGLRWTVLRPGRLSHEPACGHVAFGEDLPWGLRSTSREDVAELMVRLIDEPAAVGKALTVV
ncbi:MAG: SDR family oxidoreductase [Piscinibacter sp.]|uniref:NAD(P)-dependent oxidoreductase n=1 Tax=Piscinibacter sp. TaxID=1903157 RepID=UPI0025899D3E|nr:NAD(P)-binding oxidoreductase [Piscinibacter sp.]MCW5666616.1 SDR family oxidoreductase [Piscinibacter sp.]